MGRKVRVALIAWTFCSCAVLLGCGGGHSQPPAPVAAGLAVTPASTTLELGTNTSAKFSAILNFSDQSKIDVSSQATWSSDRPAVATVDAAGNVTGVAHGYAQISATDQGFSSTAVVAVTEAPRYVYLPGDSGRIISRAAIGPKTGQLRMEGYVITGANDIVFPCATTDPAGQFLYIGAQQVTNSGQGELLVYAIDQSTGALTPVAGSPFSESAPIGCIQFDPTGRFGYATSSDNGTNSQLLAFSRDANTGALSQTSAVPLNSEPGGVAIDPLGEYLYVDTIYLGPGTTAQAYGFAIDATNGTLTPIPGAPFPLSSATGSLSFHPSGNLLYMANTNGSSIDVYSVNRSNGVLTFGSTIATCINPSTVDFSADGDFAYSACSENAGRAPNSASVESFSIGSGGTLTHIGSAPAIAASDVIVDPSGQFLYLCSVSPYVYLYGIGQNGAATFQHKFGVPLNSGFSLAAVGGNSPVTYTTKFAYVSSTGDNSLSAYAVQADGTFGGAPIQSVAAQTAPFSLTTVPWGSDVLAASTSAVPNLSAYVPSSATGLLGAAFEFGDAANEGGVLIDPSGQWVFATDSTNGVIRTYNRIISWSLITWLTSSGTPYTTFAAGAGAGPMALDPSGQFLYVGNQGANTISAFVYPGTGPDLLEVTAAQTQPYTDGSPYSIGAKPLALAVSSDGGYLYVLCGDQTLRVFAIDYHSEGHISQVASIPLSGPPTGLAAEPSGQFVYEADSGGVNAFSLNSQTGALTPITLNPSITTANVSGVYAEASGKYLYVATSTPGTGGAIYAYTINADGSLTAVSSTPVATPNLPSSMVFSATAQ